MIINLLLLLQIMLRINHILLNFLRILLTRYIILTELVDGKIEFLFPLLMTRTLHSNTIIIPITLRLTPISILLSLL